MYIRIPHTCSAQEGQRLAVEPLELKLILSAALCQVGDEN